MSDVTRVIEEVIAGRADATNDLLPLVYQDLKRMARQRLESERAGHTLQPTALVHEAYLRLVGHRLDDWENRAHFFGAAAEAMRRILIEYARGRNRKKRGGNWQRLPLSDAIGVHPDRADELLDLDEALSHLELMDQKKAQLVKLKFFGGLSTVEAGEILGMPSRTAERHWAYARVWLYRYVEEQDDD